MEDSILCDSIYKNRKTVKSVEIHCSLVVNYLGSKAEVGMMGLAASGVH